MDTSTSNSTQDDDADWPQNTTLDLVQNGTANDTYDTLYPVPTGMIVLLSCLYGSISVLAVVGNFLVMWIVATSRRMQSVTNCYIANLALADIVIGLFAIPFQFQAALLQRWLLPHFMCPFCPFVQALSVNVSVFTLTAIAVDRHRAIITPLSAHTSKRVAKVIIVLIWLLALSLAAPMAMSWVVIMEDEQDPATKVFYKKPFCAPSDFGNHSLAIYRLLLYIFQYIIPLFVITFAYAHMAKKLWGARAPGNAQELRDANHMKNKKKVIKMLVLVVALFALCWLPLQTYLLLMSFFPSINEYRYINVIFFCFDWLAMSNSCYNPFIYAIYNEKFKKEFKQRFTFGKKHNRFANDSYEDGQSYRTRILSFRSTNDRSVYSARKSINIAAADSMKSSKRNSFHYASNQNRDNGFDYSNPEEIDGRYNKKIINRDNKNPGLRRPQTKRFAEREELPIGDERVIKMLVLVVALFALCWLPLQTYLLLMSFFPSINEYRYINVIFFCFDWLAMSNSCYNPFIYAIYNEKFKKEFKQRFTFGKKHNRFANDSYEDGQSYRTRILSFRSTNDRSVYSARKSINIAAADSMKSSKRNSFHYASNQNRDNGFDYTNPEEIDGRYNKKIINRDNKNPGLRRPQTKRFAEREELPIGDERVSELYIFPNSNIVEFRDISFDDKV